MPTATASPRTREEIFENAYQSVRVPLKPASGMAPFNGPVNAPFAADRRGWKQTLRRVFEEPGCFGTNGTQPS